MKRPDGRQLWEGLVRLTDASGDECIRSLRIALFVLLQNSASDPLLRQAQRGLLSLKSLLAPRRSLVPRSEPGRLLFCFAHKTSSNMHNLLPVAREAYRRELLGGIVSAADFSGELAEFAGKVPILTAADLKSQLGIAERSEIARKAFQVCGEISRRLSAYDSSLGATFRRNIGTVLAEAVTSLQMARGFQILFDSWSPSGVVCTSDLWPLEYQLAHQASARRIPSVVLQHGNLIYFYWPFIADLFLVWGQQSWEEMLTLGTPTERLAIGGMPASDQVFQSNREEARAEVQAEAYRPICVILSHTHARDMEAELFASYRRFLSALIPATPFVRWKVKLHPSEDRSFYDELEPAAAAPLEFYPPSTPLADALREADVVTTLYSTAGHEAMMAGRPLIIPILSPRMTEPGLLPRIQGAILVHTPEEFERELKGVTSNPEYRARQLLPQKKALDHGFSNQGHASEAIVDLIQVRFCSNPAPKPIALGQLGVTCAERRS
jgi:hypothetical protein